MSFEKHVGGLSKVRRGTTYFVVINVFHRALEKQLNPQIIIVSQWRPLGPITFRGRSVPVILRKPLFTTFGFSGEGVWSGTPAPHPLWIGP